MPTTEAAGTPGRYRRNASACREWGAVRHKAILSFQSRQALECVVVAGVFEECEVALRKLDPGFRGQGRRKRLVPIVGAGREGQAVLSDRLHVGDRAGDQPAAADCRLEEFHAGFAVVELARLKRCDHRGAHRHERGQAEKVHHRCGVDIRQRGQAARHDHRPDHQQVEVRVLAQDAVQRRLDDREVLVVAAGAGEIADIGRRAFQERGPVRPLDRQDGFGNDIGGAAHLGVGIELPRPCRERLGRDCHLVELAQPGEVALEGHDRLLFGEGPVLDGGRDQRQLLVAKDQVVVIGDQGGAELAEPGEHRSEIGACHVRPVEHVNIVLEQGVFVKRRGRDDGTVMPLGDQRLGWMIAPIADGRILQRILDPAGFAHEAD
ncbi:hypothetical protein SDC9_50970 [bioreactor metagenome]|uniref:Uncharacterized protein n=1 Tax=bioreactor metagenome TaxID=1076179 RepID=A0A644WMH6_9ZZZZ